MWEHTTSYLFRDRCDYDFGLRAQVAAKAHGLTQERLGQKAALLDEALDKIDRADSWARRSDPQ